MSPTKNAAQATPSAAPAPSSAATTATAASSDGHEQAAPRTNHAPTSEKTTQARPGAQSASYETSAPDDDSDRTSPSNAAGSTYIVECVDDNLVREPSSLTLSCGDANEGVSGLTWVAWGTSVASASGMYVVNSCDPSCADGTPISAPVHLTASAPSRHGDQQFYGRITVSFDATPPPGADAVMVYPLAH